MSQEAFVIHMAAGDTTAHLLVNATYHLLANEDTTLAKLKKELDTVMVDPRSRPEVRTLEKLPYLVRS